MNRRQLLKRVGIGAAAIPLGVGAAVSNTRPKRPTTTNPLEGGTYTRCDTKGHLLDIVEDHGQPLPDWAQAMKDEPRPVERRKPQQCHGMAFLLGG